jgi:uncharacterized protein (TIGR04255 family)
VIVGVDSGNLPSYEQPPITEVACSVLFPPIEGLLAPHIGLLWQEFQPEYPFCDDLPPIAPKIELYDVQKSLPQLKLSNVPPLPRVWFISEDETRIIQIQRDRFVHNWRKADSEGAYPRYNKIIKSFQNHLKTFAEFIEEAELGDIQPIQYELTYVNQIPQGQAWTTLEDVGKVFPDISWNANSSRFLSIPQSMNWAATFDLPDEVGRLHVSLKPPVFNEIPVLFFELTVRGIGAYNSKESLLDWFDIAHIWIVQAFEDLTNKEIQVEVWRRRE